MLLELLVLNWIVCIFVGRYLLLLFCMGKKPPKDNRRRSVGQGRRKRVGRGQRAEAAHPNFRRGAPRVSAVGHARWELPCNRWYRYAPLFWVLLWALQGRKLPTDIGAHLTTQLVFIVWRMCSPFTGWFWQICQTTALASGDDEQLSRMSISGPVLCFSVVGPNDRKTRSCYGTQLHTKVRLFYPLAHLQWPIKKWNLVHYIRITRSFNTRTGKGGRFCPLMFFVNIFRSIRSIAVIFSIPAQKWTAHLLVQKLKTRRLWGCIFKPPKSALSFFAELMPWRGCPGAPPRTGWLGPAGR